MAAERNFSTFILGDNVHQLAGELIPEIAEAVQFNLPAEPSAESLGRLVGVIGKNKVLRDNVECPAIELDLAADMVERSGVQAALSRSLWTPEIGLPVEDSIIDFETSSKVMLEAAPTATIIGGGVANWQDRTARLLNSANLAPIVFTAVGNRIMNSATEVINPKVANFKLVNGRYPTEAEYADRKVLTQVAGAFTSLSSHNTGDGDAIAARFVAEHPGLFENGTKLSFMRVANAGVQLAVQFRKAARAINSSFDSDPTNPQVFIQTDAFPIAKTEAQLGTPKEFQSPFTALRQVALTAKLLHETAVT